MSADGGPRPPRAGVEVVLPGDQRVAVNQADVSPYRWIGSVRGQLRGSTTWYSGTGVLLDEWHVLTAAHNVFDAPRRIPAARVEFIPARTRTIGGAELRPYGTLGVQRAFTPEEYQQHGGPYPPDGGVPTGTDPTEYLSDFAVLRLTSPVPDALADSPFSVGPLPATFPVAGASVYGYSGDLDPTCATLYGQTGSVAIDTGEDLISYTMSTYGGVSGAPVFYQPPGRPYQVVLGVHVSGFSSPNPALPNPGPNFGPAMNPANVTQIQAFLGS